MKVRFWKKDDFKITATSNKILIEGTRDNLRVVANRILPNDIARQYDVKAPLSYLQPLPASEIPPGSGLAYKFSPYSQWYTKLYGVVPNADLTKYRMMLRTLPDVAARIEKRVTRAVGKGFSIKCEDEQGSEAAAWLEKWCKDVKLKQRLISSGSDALSYGNGMLELVWAKMSSTQIVIEPTVTNPKGEQVRGAELEKTVRGPMRPWVEEDAICPQCNEHTLYGIRYVDNYTFYGDTKSFVSWVCRNPGCSKDDGKTIDPFRSALTNEAMQEQLGKVTGEYFKGQVIGPSTDPVKQIDYKEPAANSTPEENAGEASAPNTIVNVKDLDPLYIRPRADAYGNIFGYYQWITYPPVLLAPSMVIHYRWNPRSWGYETIYGTSILMPLVKYWDMRNRWEDDNATWTHTYGKPMLDVAAGTPEQPYSGPEMDLLAIAYSKRQPGSDALHKGNITIKPLQSPLGGGSTAAITMWVTYLLDQFHEALGVPEELMAQSGGSGSSGRSTATVKMEDFIVTTEVFQEMLAEPFENEVFPALLEAQGFTDTVTRKKSVATKKEKVTQPVRICDLQYKIVWKPVFEEDPNTKSQRIVDYRKVGLMSPNEASSEIAGLEPIREGDPRYDPALDDRMTPIPAPGSLRAEGDVGTPPTTSEQPTTGPNKLAPTKLTEPHGLDRGPFHAERILAAKARHPEFFRDR